MTTSRRLWRLAGALAVAHVVLMFTGVAFEESDLLGESRHDALAGLVHSPLATVMTGGFVEYLGFLVFLVDAVLIAQLLRGSGDLQRWLGGCIAAAGAVYAAVTIAAGFAAGAAALYDGHHGAPLSTVVSVEDVRNFGYFLSIGVLGVFTLAVAGAISATRVLPRWLAWMGYLAGALSIAAVPAARIGAVDYATLVWLLWFLALAAVAIRGPRAASAPAPAPDLARV